MQLDLFSIPPMAPNAHLITGQVGCGKTSAAIEAIIDERRFNAFAPIWVLLATDQQIHTFRDRMCAASEDCVQFGVEFFNFHTLYRRVLDRARNPQRMITDTTRFQVLRRVIDDLQAQDALQYYGDIAGLPGFIGLVAGLIDELKQSLVLPEDFAQVAARRAAKDRDLALIYSAYQDLLNERRLVDRHGAGWVAVEALERDPSLTADVAMLVVDGFDQFNRVHARLLGLLAQQVKSSRLTLPRVDGQHAARFRRFGQTYGRVLAEAPDLWLDVPLPACEDGAAPALDHLRRHLFDSESGSVAADSAVRLIEAPDRGREISAVLREIKRLLLDGVSPERIAVVARRLGGYASALRDTAAAMGIPLVVRQGMTLRENPVVAAVLALIDLAEQDFPRREMLDVLSSPYLALPDLTREQVAALVRISQQRQVVRGRDTWLAAIRDAEIALLDEDAEEAGEALEGDAAAQLAEALERHFDRVTPPESGTIYTFTEWVALLIGADPAAQQDDALDRDAQDEDVPADGEIVAATDFGVIRRARAADDDFAVRDVTALAGLRRVLLSLRTAHNLLAEGKELPVMTWGDFRALLALALDAETITPPGGQSRLGRVLATDVQELRGLPHDYVFVLGLVEGEFPETVPDDPLYAAGERADLIAAGIALQTIEERSDDLSLFYQAVGVTRQRLTLSRCTVDSKGTEAPASPYWDAVCAAVAIPASDVTRIPVGAAPQVGEVASASDLFAALGAALALEHGGEALEAAFAAHNALLDHAVWGPSWRAAVLGRTIEALREDPRQPFDGTTGVLQSQAGIAAAESALGADRTWSASQLNTLAACPFRFFAGKLLKLEQLDDPEEGLDPRQRGSVNHAILEGAYRRYAAEGLAITLDNQAQALAILDEVAADVFAEAPRKFGFRPAAVWFYEQVEMLRRLRALIRADFSDEGPLAAAKRKDLGVLPDGTPREAFRLEANFGKDGVPGLVIDGPAGPLRVRGLIDRMDRIGDRVVVVDYKTGTQKHPVTDMAAGLDFQMMIYLRAAERLVADAAGDLRVAGGLFWHIRNGEVSGAVEVSDPALEEARQHLHQQVRLARGGDFAVRPGKYEGGKCARFCDFAQMCRVGRAYLSKPDDAGRNWDSDFDEAAE